MHRASGLSRILVLFALLVTATAYGQSVIVKFRSPNSILAPSAQLKSFAQQYFTKSLDRSARIVTPSGKGQLPQARSFGFDRVIVADIAPQLNAAVIAEKLAALPEVEWAQPNYVYHIDGIETPNDSLFADQWSHSVLEVQRAWQTTKGDSGVKIGFVDTGVEWEHPDLVGQFAVNTKEDINNNGLLDAWSSAIKQKDGRGKDVFGDLDGIDNDGNGYADDVIGYDFVDQQFLNFGDASVRDGIPDDEHEFAHGTAVAGVIAAKANNREGVAGIAPGCRLVVLRAFDATGNAEDDDIASAIIYAADNGVRIINLSFGDIWPSLLQRDAIRYAESKGSLVFASSGNRGGSGRHYPSDFDECISVGATTADDGLWFGTVTGEGMDILAPGNSILTTDHNGTYQYISGTSFSAPTAAAVAGLVLSKNPKLTPRELRSILESTTDDLFPYGYDHQHSNGRVNARAAVEYTGSASVKIASPGTNDGFWADEQVEIIGSAVSTLFTGYTLSYAKGLNPDLDSSDERLWTTINTSDQQVILAPLGVWNTAGLTAGTYTLRLAVRSTNGDKTPVRSTEERITVEIKAKAPAITHATLDTVFIEEKTGLVAQVEADTLTYATIFFRKIGSNAWLSKSDDRYSHKHAIVLTTEDAEAQQEYDIALVVRNATGDTASQMFRATMPDVAVSELGFRRKSYTLPLGFVLDSVVETPQGKTVIESTFPPGSDFGRVFAFTFDSVAKRFRKTDSTKAAWVPRGFGSTDGSSRDILLQGSIKLLMYRATPARPVFGEVIRQDTTLRNGIIALGFADPDGNGIDEIVAIHQVSQQSRLLDRIEVRSAANDNFPLIAELENPTSPAREYRDNKYQKPDVRAKDLTGDGKDEVIILDDDADLLVYSQTGANTFDLIAADSNIGYTEGTMVSVGDLDGDGKQDITYAFHTTFDDNEFGEHDPKYWTVKTLMGNGDGTFRKLPPLYFWNARSDQLYRSSLGILKNVTGSGADQLGLSLFPDFYLFTYDQSAGKLVPTWHTPVSITPRTGIVHDFDGNGIPEFALGGGDSVYFYEREYLLSGRTAAPAGLEVLPRDTNRVDLLWGAVPGATKYFILRAPVGQNTFDVIDSTTTALRYSDTTVDNLARYFYSVSALDESRSEPMSDPALAILAFVHPKPVAMRFASSDDLVNVQFSQPLRHDELQGAGFLIDSAPCLTAAIASDSILVLRAANALAVGNHTLELHTDHLRDIWNSPVDTGLAGVWQHTIEEPVKRFYIVKWQFEGNARIAVEFSNRPADNALDVAHYTLSPYGTLVRVYRDNSDLKLLYIDLANTSIVGLGVPFVLCVSDITDDNGTPIEETEGNCIGTSVTESDLTNIFVYPNPVRASDERAVFARLTPEAEVSIYTVSHRFLRRLKTSDRSGGVEWDLRDEAGNQLPSGVYLYHVTGKDENGNDVEPNEASFVMVRTR